MKSKTKIWLGVGAFAIAGASATASAETPSLDRARIAESASDLALTRALISTDMSSAQKHRHAAPSAPEAKQGGEGGEGEGGAPGGVELPPDLDFALKIALLRGHLLIGDELVKEGQWAAALPHFLHPGEEIYGRIRDRLKDYNTPPFEAALKVLANTVKAKKGGDDYAKAFKTVETALAGADAGLKEKQKSWDGFVVETALEVLKSAAGEYQLAIVKGRIAKPVEYQDARGFVWQASKMLDDVAPALEKKNAEAFKRVRDGLAELKKAWPGPMPPKTPVKTHGVVLSDISRIELSAGNLM